mgnify:CR=1 FL=1
MKIHNFSAGPSILAKSVIKEASKAVIELNDIGLSLLEISHRSNHFIKIIEEAKALTKELLNISDDYEVLFLQGGASLQFYMSALNFSNSHGKSGYIDTGTWSSKAIEESKKLRGDTITIASSKDKNYNYIPKEIVKQQNLDYIHFTSNNTIYGTQYHSFQNILNHYPETALICDMSSDIFSREINVNNFALIYAGAQKNLGPAGTTLVIIKKSIFNQEKTHFSKNHLKHINNLPSYLKYTTHIDKSSMFNTPPVFSIYTCMLTLRWLKKIGGIATIAEKNQKKSNLIYREIDRNSLFKGYTKKEDRSMMNATFTLKNSDLKDKFEKLCIEKGISGINGHRSVGGYRASMYNALDIESVNALTETMQQLEKIG